MQNNGISKKFKICEKNQAKNLREAAKFLEDNVYTRIADLNTDERMLSGITLTEIRDMINTKEDIDMKNNEVKSFLVEFLEDSIQFCESDRKNQPLMVFSSSLDISDVINTLRALDSVKVAAKVIRSKLLNVDFGLQDKFCDAEELKHSWRTTKIPDELLIFFAELFNIKKTTLLKEYYNSNDEIEQESEQEQDDILKSMKIGSLFQVTFYNMHNGYKRTPLHIMNSVEIYERCKSKELITSFNRSGLCISYTSMKNHRSDLAKFAVAQSSENGLPLPSHFSSNMFTISALDNFDHSDKNTLSGKSSSHDTVITLFQEVPTQKESKPLRSEVNLQNVKTLSKLHCQELVPFSTDKTLTVPETFTVQAETYNSPEKQKSIEMKKILESCVRGNADASAVTLPSWAGTQALLSKSEVPLMHVAFLPFLPQPVTDIATVYTAMLNYVKLLNQLEQKTLPIFCDEGVFRLVLNIYLKRPQQFKDLVPMLGGFHMAMCVQRCIGKYIKGTGLEDALVETGVFGVKVMESFIGGTDYVRSLRDVQILSSAIELAKWKAFWKLHDKKDFEDSIQALKEFANFSDKKNQNNCIKMYEDLKEKTKPLPYQFNSFSKACTERSEVCKYWDGVIDLTSMLHNLIAPDREGDWEGHLQAVQDLLPVFCEADCINYLRYATCYLEKMRKLDQEHPDLYAEFHAEKFVVQTSAGNFKAVSPDMKPEQTINRSQKSSGGIVGQTKTDSYVSEWELVYHEVLAISNCFSNLTKSKTRTGPHLHHELAGGIGKQLSESMNKVTEFITERGNPYETLTPTPLHNITGGQVVPKPHSKRLLNYFEDGKQRYKVFREESYVNKSKKLSDTITKVNLPKFDGKDQKQKKESKPVLKKVGDAQKQIDIARARGISMKEILSFDHLTSNLLFEEDLTAKQNKSDLVKQLEKQLTASDTTFTAESKLRTAIVVDFMSLIRRYPVSKLKTFDDLFRTATYSVLHAPCTEEIDIVYDSYLDDSIKECERIRRRSSCEPLEFGNMKTTTPIPVQMDRFWACGSNKEAIQ